jgi:hypothetical protein
MNIVFVLFGIIIFTWILQREIADTPMPDNLSPNLLLLVRMVYRGCRTIAFTGLILSIAWGVYTLWNIGS